MNTNDKNKKGQEETNHRNKALKDDGTEEHPAWNSANNSSASHRCSECHKCFSQRKLLNRHIRTLHADNNPNTCEVGRCLVCFVVVLMGSCSYIYIYIYIKFVN